MTTHTTDDGYSAGPWGSSQPPPDPRLRRRVRPGETWWDRQSEKPLPRSWWEHLHDEPQPVEPPPPLTFRKPARPISPRAYEAVRPTKGWLESLGRAPARDSWGPIAPQAPAVRRSQAPAAAAAAVDEAAAGSLAPRADKSAWPAAPNPPPPPSPLPEAPGSRDRECAIRGLVHPWIGDPTPAPRVEPSHQRGRWTALERYGARAQDKPPLWRLRGREWLPRAQPRIVRLADVHRLLAPGRKHRASWATSVAVALVGLVAAGVTLERARLVSWEDVLRLRLPDPAWRALARLAAHPSRPRSLFVACTAHGRPVSGPRRRIARLAHRRLGYALRVRDLRGTLSREPSSPLSGASRHVRVRISRSDLRG